MNAWIESISESIRTGPSDLQISHLYEVILTPVAVICGVSLLLTMLWVLGVWEYLWLKQCDKDRCSQRRLS